MTANTSNTEPHKLETTFDGDDVIHTVYRPDPAAEGGEVKDQTKWKQKKIIGQGAFGEVTLQEEEGREKFRAVKKLSRQARNVNWSQELDTLAGLREHPSSFVQFLGWYESHDFIFFAMEYVEHGDLSQYLKNYELQARSEAKKIIRQLVEGLVILHEREICHRDLKPQNILIAAKFPIWVKIADFGVSKRQNLTDLRTNCGTPNYRAPELNGLLPGKFSTGKSFTNFMDMWSLGVIAHEILTSEIPFLQTPVEPDSESDAELEESTTTDMDLLFRYCHGLKKFPTQALQNTSVSYDGIRLVTGLLAANPGSRLSAREALGSSWLSGGWGQDEPGYQTSQQCLPRLESYIRKRGLGSFFPRSSLSSLASRGAKLVNKLRSKGCTMEIAAQFIPLILYDIAILIDDSDEMALVDESGSRVHVIQEYLNLIFSISSLARNKGIATIQFVNSDKGETNVAVKTVKTILEGHKFGGESKLGTELKTKILDKFNHRKMVKPLVVIVLVNGKVKGEDQQLLKSVITDTISKGPGSVAFQFCLFGSESTTSKTFLRLAKAKEFREYVDWVPFSHIHNLEDIDHLSETKWVLICRSLLGAISDYWGNSEYELDGELDSEAEGGSEEIEDSEDSEEAEGN